jgi:exosome complex component RRP41
MSRFDLMSPEGLRVDGRRSGELRLFQGRMGQLDCDGSAFVKQGATWVLVQCHGPTQSLPQKSNFTVVFQLNGGGRRRELLELAALVHSALKSLINTQSQVHLHVHVLQIDGGILACAINACCLALVDAAIPLQHLISSVSVGIVTPQGKDSLPILDLNHVEENQEVPCITVAFVRTTGRIVLMHVIKTHYRWSRECILIILKAQLILQRKGVRRLRMNSNKLYECMQRLYYVEMVK